MYAIFASTFVAVFGTRLPGCFAVRPLVMLLYLPQAVVSVFVIMFGLIGARPMHNNITGPWMIMVFGVPVLAAVALLFPFCGRYRGRRTVLAA